MARIHDNELVVDQNFADADDAASTSSHATFRRPAFSPYDTPDGFVPLYGGRTPNQFMRTSDFDSPGSLRKRRSSFALSDIFEREEVEIEILPPDAPAHKTLRRSKSWQTITATFTRIVKRLKPPHEA